MRGETILIADDEKLIRWNLRTQLGKAGFGTIEAESVLETLKAIHEQQPDLIILDQRMPDGTGLDVLRSLHKDNQLVPVIMLTAEDRSDTAVQAMKLGAFDYVTKPVNIEELKRVIDRVLEATKLKRQVAQYIKSQESGRGFCGLLGSSRPMTSLFDTISRIAQSDDTTVLITGESGTGKELTARAVHSLSSRRDQPMMTVNFSALTESLIESELFGHEKGAFTDAKARKKGIFELAGGGTIFLDEIGDASPKVQVRLLRVLEQKSFRRVGGDNDITVNVRVLAATNQVLAQRVAEGQFREDLFYRLNVANITVPPLRERGGDILMLAECFLQEFNAKFHKQFGRFSGSTSEALQRYSWPGNVRELRNLLERAVLLGDGEELRIDETQFADPQRRNTTSGNPGLEPGVDGISLSDLEKDALVNALAKTGNNQSHAAKLLKITRDTLRYRMKKHGLLPF